MKRNRDVIAEEAEPRFSGGIGGGTADSFSRAGGPQSTVTWGMAIQGQQTEWTQAGGDLFEVRPSLTWSQTGIHKNQWPTEAGVKRAAGEYL